jgi:hypothetical protein
MHDSMPNRLDFEFSACVEKIHCREQRASVISVRNAPMMNSFWIDDFEARFIRE